MISYVLTTVSYTAIIFKDTINYQLTRNSNLQTNFLLCQEQDIKLQSPFKCNSLYSKIWQPMRNKAEKEKK